MSDEANVIDTIVLSKNSVFLIDNAFLVEEYIDLVVDETPAPEDILQPFFPNNRSQSMSSVADWRHAAARPAAGSRKVQLAIGRVQRTGWSEVGLTAMLSQPGSRLAGSGLWVMQALLKIRPESFGTSSTLAFPDAETSRWEYVAVRGGGIHFPCLDSSKGAIADESTWRLRLHGIRDEFNPHPRICLTVVEGATGVYPGV